MKRLASNPNPTTSKLASEALKTIGEELPHKLSQQVPIWTVEDVVFWVNRVSVKKKNIACFLSICLKIMYENLR